MPAYWSTGRNVIGDTSREVPSTVTFGVELEVSECNNASGLNGLTCFGAKNDGSVNGAGREFVSPVLAGDAGYAVVDNFVKYAEAHEWDCDESCGYHIHLGISQFSEESKLAIAMGYVLTAELWGRFVNSRRKGNTYCAPIAVSAQAVDNAPTFNVIVRAAASGPDHRYTWCNFAAYSEHGTIEIRLHNGTIKRAEVLNWIKAHTKFVAALSKMTRAQVRALFADKSVAGQFRVLEGLWQSRDVSEFYRKRAAKESLALHL